MVATRKSKLQEDIWMTLRQAALALGQTRHSVLTRIVKGELEAQIVAGRTVVSRESVERARQA